MKILQINITHNIGSTGRILEGISRTIRSHGDEAFAVTAVAKEDELEQLYCFYDSKKAHYACLKNIAISRITGKMGYREKNRTRKCIEWIKQVDPDVIHLHNFHGDWIHIRTLFEYIKNSGKPVVWTLHDCWPFTGRCSHFALCGCEKWKTGCCECNNMRVYPYSYFFDFSKQMYEDKKAWFTGLNNAHITTPSRWLSEYVSESYLGEYPSRVINNGIDVNQFRRMPSASPMKMDSSKRVLLGVANTWTKNKGLEDICKLDHLIDHSVYQIVLVGVNARAAKQLPESVIKIAHTDSIDELAKLYSSAFCFLNLTYLDNYPTTNMEAQCCGCPVITYKTGGSPENILGGYSKVLEQGDVDGIIPVLYGIGEMTEAERQMLSERARKIFDQTERFEEYYRVYLEMTGNVKNKIE